MASVKITRIFRGDKETKFGLRNSVGIKTVEFGDKWVSGLFDPAKGKNGTEDWKDGDTVEIFTTEKDGYVNFTLKPKVGDTSALESRIKKLEEAVFNKESKDLPDSPDAYDDF